MLKSFLNNQTKISTSFLSRKKALIFNQSFYQKQFYCQTVLRSSNNVLNKQTSSLYEQKNLKNVNHRLRKPNNKQFYSTTINNDKQQTNTNERKKFSSSRVIGVKHSAWWRLFDFAVVLPAFALLVYAILDQLEQTLPDNTFPDKIKGPLRSARAALTMITIAFDYKYTYWKYPELSKTYQKHLMELTERALEGMDSRKSVGELQEQEKLINDLRSALHERSAVRLLKLLQTNKGLYIKVGQVLSSMNHVLPKEYTNTLRVLQQSAPSVPYETVRKTIREEFGKEIEEIFEIFEEAPLASASLAQVHRAVTLDGREVAVKVQYPQLRKQFAGDMWVHEMTLKAADFLFEDWDFSWSHNEISSNLEKELDFLNEAANGRRTKANFANNPNMYVPTSYPDLTSTRVLTMEFIHGVSIIETEKIKEMGINIEKMLKETITGVAQQIFLHGFVHCDPHPGNIFVRKTKDNRDQVVLLDHGLCRELNESTRLNFCRLWEALVLQDDKNVIDASYALGVKQWEMFAAMLLFRPYRGTVGLGQRASSADRRKTAQMFHKLQDQLSETMKSMPRELLLVMRNQAYIRYLDKELGSPVNRYTTMARVAVQGLTFQPNPPLPKTDEARLALEGVLHTREGFFSNVRRRVWFEVKLSWFAAYYWTFAQIVALTRVFGKSDESKRLIEIYDESMAVPPKI